MEPGAQARRPSGGEGWTLGQGIEACTCRWSRDGPPRWRPGALRGKGLALQSPAELRREFGGHGPEQVWGSTYPARAEPSVGDGHRGLCPSPSGRWLPSQGGAFCLGLTWPAAWEAPPARRNPSPLPALLRGSQTPWQPCGRCPASTAGAASCLSPGAGLPWAGPHAGHLCRLGPVHMYSYLMLFLK